MSLAGSNPALSASQSIHGWLAAASGPPAVFERGAQARSSRVVAEQPDTPVDKPPFKTIDEYISTCSKEVQGILEDVRQAIRKSAPEAVEAISYQIPSFKLHGRNLVHFAAYTRHIALYPAPSGTVAFRQALSPYRSGKGTIRFPLGKPIPYDLVHSIVVFRMKEQRANERRRSTQGRAARGAKQVPPSRS